MRIKFLAQYTFAVEVTGMDPKKFRTRFSPQCRELSSEVANAFINCQDCTIRQQRTGQDREYNLMQLASLVGGSEHRKTKIRVSYVSVQLY